MALNRGKAALGACVSHHTLSYGLASLQRHELGLQEVRAYHPDGIKQLLTVLMGVVTVN